MVGRLGRSMLGPEGTRAVGVTRGSGWVMWGPGRGQYGQEAVGSSRQGISNVWALGGQF